MPTIPGYNFEFVPTPLASGGVALFIDDKHGYRILEKASNEAFQALWVEISFVKKKNIICGVVYRQHNSPERFQKYFEETIGKFVSLDKQICVLGDFNIDLLKAQSSNYSHDFLWLFKVVISFQQSINQLELEAPRQRLLIISSIFQNRC